MKKLLFTVLMATLAMGASAQTLAFPTAEGFGKYASGGRGGEVVEVTNLEDDPDNPIEGSLRWALKQNAGKPITIVFRVSGTIDLKGNDLRSNRSNVTIAGQTAPGDGICIKGGCLNLGGSRNLIIRYIRSRVGVLNDNTYCPGTVVKENFIPGAALNIENGGNFIVDHCSFGWSAEENVGWYDNDHTTVQWCMFTEGLYDAGHGKGARSYGAVLGGKTASYHHNLLAHNYSRSPRFGSTTKNDKVMLLDFVNNVNYNWGRQGSCYGGDNRQGDEGLFQLNFVNNYYKPGPARNGDNKNNFIGASFCNPAQGSQGSSYGKWHLSGNYMEGSWAKSAGVNTDNYKAFDISAYQENVPGLTLADMQSDHLDVGEFAVNTESAQDAYNSVLEKAGAFPRDAIDKRIVNEVKNGTAQYYGSCNGGKTLGIIDKPSDAGGYPDLKTYNEIVDNDHDGMDDEWEVQNGFDPTNPADRNTVLKGGYTALEAYLCSLVGEKIEINRDQKRPFDIIVAKDGTGDYTTINEAINAAPDNGERTIIFVKNGTYEEKVFVGNRYAESKKIISIIGESKDGVIISWDDYHGKSIEYPGKGTINADGMTAPTMTVTSPDFYMENVTVRNTTKDNVAQAEALYQCGDRQVLKNVNIEGYQDTHRQKKTKRYFYYDCTIKGNVDFIYGGGTAYYYLCNIVSRPLTRTSTAGGYITAPEDIDSKGQLESGAPLYYEYFFKNCKLTAEDGASGAYLSRPWADNNCGTIYLNCVMGNHISQAGFGGNGNKTNMSFGEYKSKDLDGNDIDLSGRVDWAQKLTNKDAVACGLNKIYNAISTTPFDPISSVVGVAPVTDVQVNDGFLTWTGSAGTRGYIVYNNGEIIAYTDGSTYDDPQKRGGTYHIRAIANNGALSPMDGEEYTLNAEQMNTILNPTNDDEAGEIKKCTISLSCDPVVGGKATVSKKYVLEGEEITLTATANEGYHFKNWTLAAGNVLGTDAELKLNVTEDMDIVAHFTIDPKPIAHHSPVNSDGLNFELTYLLNAVEETTNAATGAKEFCLAHEYTDWIRYNVTPLQTTNRNFAKIDAKTGEPTANLYWFSQEPFASTLNQTTFLPVVSATKKLSLYVKDCDHIVVYFNGSSSTPGTLQLDIIPTGESKTSVKSTIPLGKKTTEVSDALTANLDGCKTYEIQLLGTSDMSVWAVALQKATSSGIQETLVDTNNHNKAIYNLAGQRVGKDYKGIVIINGKKMVK